VSARQTKHLRFPEKLFEKKYLKSLHLPIDIDINNNYYFCYFRKYSY